MLSLATPDPRANLLAVSVWLPTRQKHLAQSAELPRSAFLQEEPHHKVFDQSPLRAQEWMPRHPWP